MASFEIADCPTQLVLAPTPGGASQGTLSLTVRSTMDRTGTGRVRVSPGPQAKPEWFAIDTAPATSPLELTTEFAPRATQTIKVNVNVPIGTPGGAQRLRVLALSESDTDADVAQSGEVAFTVPEPAKPQPVAPKAAFPWLIVAAGAVVVVMVIGVVAWLLLSGDPKAPVVAVTIERDVDRLGQDYRSFDLDTADPELCRQACASEAQCRAFTYVPVGVQGPKARCWLKTAVPPQIPHPGMVSGVKGG